MKWVFIAAALSFAPVVAVAQVDGTVTLSPEGAHKVTELGKQKQSEAKKTLKTLSSEEIRAALNDNLKDKTKIIYQKGYGVYVEYSAPDGSDRMWFPGNRGAVRGVWGLRDMSGKPHACFHYFNSRNYVTGEFESTECIDPEVTLGNADVIDEKTGDVFNLMPGQIPYVKSSMDVPTWPSLNPAATAPAPSGQ